MTGKPDESPGRLALKQSVKPAGQVAGSGPSPLPGLRPVQARRGGFVDIGDYGVLGDGRTVALVASDGRIDWWPVPQIDSPPVFAAVLDPDRGGCFVLAPVEPATCERRYIPGTNVLETTYVTASGRVKVLDSLNTGAAGRLPWTELARRVEGLQGEVEMAWHVVPGDRFGSARPTLSHHRGVPVFTVDDQLVAVVTAGTEPGPTGGAGVGGRFVSAAGSLALVALLATDDEPLFIDDARAVLDRVGSTVASWQRWAQGLDYRGRWGQSVERSALALKSLLFEVGGAIAAAATTSLPERVGGDKNWDYRYAWVRDSAFTVDAFVNLGLTEEVHSAVSWLLSALRRSAPDLHVFYTLEGDVPKGSKEIDVPGYRDSRPVRAGNDAAKQVQLGTYGDLFDMLGHYCDAGHVLDKATGEMLANLADQCAKTWKKKDSGIWELTRLEHYTISKIGCWVALDRAARMAGAGQIPSDHAAHWHKQASAIKEWVAEHCWSESQQSYTFYAGTEDVDASVLLAGRTGFDRGPRLASTIEAVIARLARGPMVYRYTGMDKEEGAFIACTFWLVSALAHNGQVERASALMDEAVALGNDLGLLAEQIDPDSGALLGNIPQGLSHLALINAAHAIANTST